MAWLVGALTVSVVLGASYLFVDRLVSSAHDPIDHPAHPLTDEQARAQVVEAAKEFVGTS